MVREESWLAGDCMLVKTLYLLIGAWSGWSDWNSPSVTGWQKKMSLAMLDCS